MAISFCVMVALMLGYHFVPAYHFTPGLQIVAVAIVALTVVLGVGVAYLLSAITVTYRDFRFLIRFTVPDLMYASFVAYPAPASLPIKHPIINQIVMINPMYGIIDGFRWSLLGTRVSSALAADRRRHQSGAVSTACSTSAKPNAALLTLPEMDLHEHE